MRIKRNGSVISVSAYGRSREFTDTKENWSIALQWAWDAACAAVFVAFLILAMSLAEAV